MIPNYLSIYHLFQAARAAELERELAEARRQLKAAGIGEGQEGSGEA